MNTSANTLEAVMPLELQSWIADLCHGRTAISVGHRMFSVNENISNIPVEQLMYLIRASSKVAAYVGGDETRQQQVAAYVAECISQFVLAKFRTAQYPGD